MIFPTGPDLSLCLATQPDGDGDLVPDAHDACPQTEAGEPVDADGCSTADDDADGVLNDQDRCANTPTCATNIDANGCAIDSDGDGVFDGCPVAPQELDGDGVPNAQDECPDTPPGTAVDERGCPSCCGAAGPVAPLGLVVGMLLLARLSVRRRRQ